MIPSPQRQFLIIVGTIVFIITIISISVIQFSPSSAKENQDLANEKVINAETQKTTDIPVAKATETPVISTSKDKTDDSAKKAAHSAAVTGASSVSKNSNTDPVAEDAKQKEEKKVADNAIESTNPSTEIKKEEVKKEEEPVVSTTNVTEVKTDETSEPIQHENTKLYDSTSSAAHEENMESSSGATLKVKGSVLPCSKGRCFDLIEISGFDDAKIVKIFMSIGERDNFQIYNELSKCLIQMDKEDFDKEIGQMIKIHMGKMVKDTFDGITFQHSKTWSMSTLFSDKPKKKNLEKFRANGFISLATDLSGKGNFFAILTGKKDDLEHFVLGATESGDKDK